MPEQTLSFCALVGGDSATLARCLASVRPVVQEIVLVDTGQGNGLRAIAARFGAKVHRLAGETDRSAARNLALDRATGDWVLTLEPNEELAKASQVPLRQDLIPWRADDPLIYYLARHLFVQPGEKPGAGVTTYAKPILFPRHPGFRYREPLYEYLAFTGNDEQAKTMNASDLLVHHYLYAADEQARRSQAAEEQLARRLEQDPDDMYLRYQYCRQLFQRQDYVPCMTEAYKVLTANYPTPRMKPIILGFTAYFGAYGAYELGRTEAALDLALMGVWHQYNLYGPWQVLARAYLNRQYDARSKLQVEGSLDLEPVREWLADPSRQPVRRSWGAFLFMGLLAMARGDADEAERLLAQAAALQPTFNAPLIARLENALLADRPQQALVVLDAQGERFPHFQELLAALRRRLQQYAKLPKRVPVDRQSHLQTMLDLIRVMKEDWSS